MSNAVGPRCPAEAPTLPMCKKLLARETRTRKPGKHFVFLPDCFSHPANLVDGRAPQAKDF